MAVRIDGGTPLSAALIENVRTLCDRAEDGDLPGLVVIGVGGVPADGWTRGLSVDIVSKWERVLRRLERLNVPTVAVASGDCGGPAADVMLATDFRIATPDTRLIVSVDQEATWPGMSLYRLARQVGPDRIRQAALLGVPIDATEARQLGLIDEVAADPAPALAALAERASGIAGKELAIRRQLIFDASRTAFEDALGAHLAACDRALRRVTTS
ncbi:enoyl-CoA-hydratase DpgB [Luedemannella flava]|uniref:enoyl-CoA-hydratase DpgB n=1 Tax=Luedemannella flava TaxID=349316 RepID=UPI0031DB71C8